MKFTISSSLPFVCRRSDRVMLVDYVWRENWPRFEALPRISSMRAEARNVHLHVQRRVRRQTRMQTQRGARTSVQCTGARAHGPTSARVRPRIYITYCTQIHNNNNNNNDNNNNNNNNIYLYIYVYIYVFIMIIHVYIYIYTHL